MYGECQARSWNLLPDPFEAERVLLAIVRASTRQVNLHSDELKVVFEIQIVISVAFAHPLA